MPILLSSVAHSRACSDSSRSSTARTFWTSGACSVCFIDCTASGARSAISAAQAMASLRWGAVGHQPVDQADLQRPLPVDAPAGVEQVHRLLQPDDLGQCDAQAEPLVEAE